MNGIRPGSRPDAIMKKARIVLETTVFDGDDAVFAPVCAARGERQLYLRIGTKGMFVVDSSVPAAEEETERDALGTGDGDPRRSWTEAELRRWCFVNGVELDDADVKRDIVAAVEARLAELGRVGVD